MRIDFPAPVSPVSTLRPGANGTVASSITARFLILSSLSIPRPQNGVALGEVSDGAVQAPSEDSSARPT